MGFCDESFVGCSVTSLGVKTCSRFSNLFMLVGKLLCFRRASRSMLTQVFFGHLFGQCLVDFSVCVLSESHSREVSQYRIMNLLRF